MPIRTRSNGYTFIELAVVLVIIATAVGIAYPTLTPRDGHLALKMRAKRLASVIRYTHDLAVSRRQTYRLHLDTEAQRYWVSTGSTDPNAPGQGPSDLQGQLPQGFGFARVEVDQQDDTELPTVYFSPTGWVSPAVIELTNPKEQMVRLTVDQWSGHVDVQADMDE